MSANTRVAVWVVRAAFVAALGLELLALHFPTPSGVDESRQAGVRATWHAAADVGRAGGRFVPDALDPILDPLIDDKTAHFFLFLPLGLLAATERRMFGPLSRRRVAWLALGLMLYALVGELSQSLNGRVPEPGDVLANVLGALAGILAVALFTRRPKPARAAQRL